MRPKDDTAKLEGIEPVAVMRFTFLVETCILQPTTRTVPVTHRKENEISLRYTSIGHNADVARMRKKASPVLAGASREKRHRGVIRQSLSNHCQTYHPSIVCGVVRNRISASGYPVRTFDYFVFIGMELEGLPLFAGRAFL